MRSSLRLLLVGVGTWVALGNVAAGTAKPVSNQSQNSDQTKPATAFQANSSPQRWLQSIPNAGNQLRQNISFNVPELGFVDRLTASDPKPPAMGESLSVAGDAQSSQQPAQIRSISASPRSVAVTQPSPAQAVQAPNQPQASARVPASGAAPAIKTAQTNVSPLLQPAQPTQTSPLPSIYDPVVEPVAKPIGPAKPGAAPEYLNPDPNPLSFPTQAEEVRLRGIQPISLQQALDLAERNSPTYQTARLQLERSRAALREAEASLYPTLSVQAGVSRSESPGARLTRRETEQAQPGLNLQGSANRGFSSSATLNYDIFTSGRRTAQIRAAAQQVRTSQLEAEVVREQLRLDVTNAYYDLQQADSSVGIGRAAVRNAQISLRDAQALERAGIGTRFDVLQAQVQLANSQQQLRNAQSQQQINRRQLAQLLNISPAIDLAAADPVEAAGEWNLSLENTIIAALKNRAELEQQLAQRELAEQQKRIALSALGPTLSVSAQYQLLDQFTDTLGVAGGYTVQAGLSWQLFDGGAVRARAAQQEANIAIAETNFSNVRNQIRFQVEQAYSSLLANRENITTARLAVEQATEALRLARLRFQAGVGTQTDVINSVTDLTNAQGSLINAILGYNRSLATLRRAVTNLPIPTGEQTPAPVPAPASPALNQGVSEPGQPGGIPSSGTVPAPGTTPLPGGTPEP
ncbi:TolC family protein [Leptothermofonsia sichuanensis E412]|uniref:TolC family protein n=1 Tax=Leptothermofonsia sichuanensis TaxID=2917832 RepID=UPI001CA70887|nr:TolC family protein [Leptothermofonsia sichuanensis]QZZ22730.1 TolC family protein [Leptothermofonsia sichuanensis E412]